MKNLSNSKLRFTVALGAMGFLVASGGAVLAPLAVGSETENPELTAATVTTEATEAPAVESEDTSVAEETPAAEPSEAADPAESASPTAENDPLEAEVEEEVEATVTAPEAIAETDITESTETAESITDQEKSKVAAGLTEAPALEIAPASDPQPLKAPKGKKDKDTTVLWDEGNGVNPLDTTWEYTLESASDSSNNCGPVGASYSVGVSPRYSIGGDIALRLKTHNGHNRDFYAQAITSGNLDCELTYVGEPHGADQSGNPLKLRQVGKWQKLKLNFSGYKEPGKVTVEIFEKDNQEEDNHKVIGTWSQEVLGSPAVQPDIKDLSLTADDRNLGEPTLDGDKYVWEDTLEPSKNGEREVNLQLWRNGNQAASWTPTINVNEGDCTNPDPNPDPDPNPNPNPDPNPDNGDNPTNPVVPPAGGDTTTPVVPGPVTPPVAGETTIPEEVTPTLPKPELPPVAGVTETPQPTGPVANMTQPNQPAVAPVLAKTGVPAETVGALAMLLLVSGGTLLVLMRRLSGARKTGKHLA